MSRYRYPYSRTVAKQARVTRTLELVQLGHGRLTTTWVTGMTGWTQRSAERYLADLQAAGLVDRDRVGGGHCHYWSITDQGRAQLSGARAA